MSNLLVQNIKHTNGTTAQTIDSSGRITTPARPAFLAFPSSSFSTGTGAGTTRIFDSTQHNIGGHYSTSTGKFTVPIAGVYLFGATLATDTTASAIVYMSAEITFNGSLGTNKRYHGGWGDKTDAMNTHHREHFSVQLNLAVGDTAQFSHESNVDVSILAGQNGRHTAFWGHLIG
jgi:hypothetical protein